MATLNYPRYLPKNSHLAASISRRPYILMTDGTYPEGVNHYLHDRASGLVFDGPRAKKIRPNTLKAVGNQLTNFLTWIETNDSHPQLGQIHWPEVKEWQVDHLYQNAQTLGIWSRDYFLTGNRSFLDPVTISDRVEEVKRCYRWMEKKGYLSGFTNPADFTEMGEAFLDSNTPAQPVNANDSAWRSKPWKVREQPGSNIPPSPEQLYDFFKALSRGPHRLAAMHIFETGLRLAELTESTLLPGRNFRRNPDCIHFLPTWPTSSYRLDWSANDNLMLGVLPTQADAWGSRPRRTTDCQYRILGKGLKIRLIDVPERSMQVLWQYADGAREASLRKAGVSLYRQPAELFLDRYANPISAHALQDAFRRASDKIKIGYRFSAHPLRHAFACNFLETAIIARAQDFGDQETRLTFEMIEKHGDFVISILQKKLGHAWRETTMIYLEQLKSGQVLFNHAKVWNDYLDQFREGL